MEASAYKSNVELRAFFNQSVAARQNGAPITTGSVSRKAAFTLQTFKRLRRHIQPAQEHEAHEALSDAPLMAEEASTDEEITTQQDNLLSQQDAMTSPLDDPRAVAERSISSGWQTHDIFSAELIEPTGDDDHRTNSFGHEDTYNKACPSGASMAQPHFDDLVDDLDPSWEEDEGWSAQTAFPEPSLGQRLKAAAATLTGLGYRRRSQVEMDRQDLDTHALLIGDVATISHPFAALHSNFITQSFQSLRMQSNIVATIREAVTSHPPAEKLNFRFIAYLLRSTRARMMVILASVSMLMFQGTLFLNKTLFAPVSRMTTFTPSWREIQKPFALYNLSAPGQLKTLVRYEAKRHMQGGGRVDQLTYGALSGGAPWLKIAIYRHGSETIDQPPLYVDNARFATDSGVSVNYSSQTYVAPTRFGDFEVSNVTLKTPEGERSNCLGFRSLQPAIVSIGGLTCGEKSKRVDETGLSCLIDRLDLLSAGEDVDLRTYFSRGLRQSDAVCAARL